MEEFFKNYQHTFAAIGSIGTMLAVFISLAASSVAIFLAFNKFRPKVKLTAEIMSNYDIINSEEILEKAINNNIGFFIKNVGAFPIVSGIISLKANFAGDAILLLSTSGRIINPGEVASFNFYIDIESIKKSIQAAKIAKWKKRYFLGFKVEIDGKLFDIKPSKLLKKKIRSFTQ
ncbi:MAG: hypothetical protein K0R25_667 [Rickettsiaceae bacterium]|jgi:archaellum component FlaG (FlaF/FlaG flagellin family)|nr:hypothetical protein [Rickettsiaceae bacterium]